MNNQTYKSIISALAGAAVVLLSTLIVLFFTKGENANTADNSTKIENPSPVTVPGTKEEEAKEAFVKEPVKPIVEEFVPVKINDQEVVNEIVKVDKDVKESNKQSNEIELAPIVKVFESNKNSKLNDFLTEQKTGEAIPESHKQGTKPIRPIQKTAVDNKVASKSQTPEDNELQPIDQQDLSSKTAIERLFDESIDFLTLTSKDFETKWSKLTGAVWTDNLKSSARSVEALKFMSVSSNESIFSFRDKRLTKVSMMLYNKGDDELISEKMFNLIKMEALNSLQAHIGRKPLFKPNAGVAKNNIYFWVHKNHLYKLEYSTSKQGKIFVGEYIRIVVTKGSNRINVINIDKASTDILNEAELRAMVSRKGGDVLINGIPMVDQGAKGYCACAALARLITYFGRDIDQHDIAKLAGSSSENGTDPGLLKKAVESMSAKLRLNMKVLAKPYLSNPRDAARLETKLSSLIARMEEKDLKSVYNRFAFEDRRYKEFEKNVINSIDRGRPVSWALNLGIVPEPEIPQANGGHMRIITGYNRVKKVLYYTDTWGAGHEKKSMDMATAFYISLAVWEISPR